MAWTAVTSEDVLSEFTLREQEAVTASQDGEDSLDGILTRTLAMARGFISAAGHTLGDAGTVPDQMLHDVIAVARWRLLVSVAALKPLATEHRKQAHDNAMKRFESVGSGDLRVELASAVPDDNWQGNWGGQERLLMRTDDPTDDNT